MTKHTLWPRAVSEPMYKERLLAALPKDHILARRRTLTWNHLRDDTLLVQGWDESQAAREFYSTFLGSGVRYATHAASKQSVLGLVAAGFGITLVTEAQTHVKVPNVVYRPILEKNALVKSHSSGCRKMKMRLLAASSPSCANLHAPRSSSEVLGARSRKVLNHRGGLGAGSNPEQPHQ